MHYPLVHIHISYVPVVLAVVGADVEGSIVEVGTAIVVTA